MALSVQEQVFDYMIMLAFSVEVGEETPRTVCSGLVGSEPLEELQVK